VHQGKIKELLKEAATNTWGWRRMNDIHCELADATAATGEDGVVDIDGPQAGLRLVVDALFVSTAQNRPEALPGLLPVFSLLCGDREEGILLADIDWSQVDGPKQS